MKFHAHISGIARPKLRIGFVCLMAVAMLVLGGRPAVAARAEEVAAGLQHPWAFAFIEGGRMLVTERVGRIRVVEPDGRLGDPLEGVPRTALAIGHSGMLDLILDQDFANNRQLYFCFSEPGKDGASTALARARLSADRRKLESVKVIFSSHPKVHSLHHFGCRIVQSPDRHLFLAVGDREQHMEEAQTFVTHHGKVIRVTTDGTVPAGNPFVGKAGVLPEIWSYGHRNIQGAALSSSGALWTVEHGPLGGDELNQVKPGKNYGWPVISYGKDYNGGPIGAGVTHAEGMEQPAKHWSTIAPSGLAFVRSDKHFPRWQGSMLIGSLKGSLLRLEIEGDVVVREHTVWSVRGERVRDVREAPDGTIFFLTDHSTNGRVLRLRP